MSILMIEENVNRTGWRMGYITVCNVTFDVVPGEYILHDQGPRIVLGILILLIFILGVFGNLSVILAVALSKRLQTITNIFVVNLAVADLVTSAFLPVHASTLLSGNGCYIPDLLCKFVAAVSLTTICCSVVTLAMIAFNRFHVIYGVLKPEPVFVNAFRVRNILIMVAFSWLYPIVLMCIIIPLAPGTLGYSLQYKVCLQNSDEDFSDYLTIIACLLVQFPAFVVIIVCYSIVFKMFRRHQDEMNSMLVPSVRYPTSSSETNTTFVEDSVDGCGPKSSHSEKISSQPAVLHDIGSIDDHTSSNEGEKNDISPTNGTSPEREPTSFVSTAIHPEKPPDNPNHLSPATMKSLPRSSSEGTLRERYKQQLKITKNLFIVVCVYTICVMPPAITYLIPSSDPAVPWLTVLFLCNSCANPIIYSLRHPTFSEVLTSMFRCRLRDIPQPSGLLKWVYDHGPKGCSSKDKSGESTA